MKYPLYHDTLCQKVWEGTTLRPEVQQALLKIANDFVKNLAEDNGIKLDVQDIVMIGSLTNYNWTNYSDIDLHIVTDYKKLDMDADTAQTMFDAIKGVWNNKHDIKIKGHDVELYIQDIGHKTHSPSEYSVLNNKWNREPVKEKPTFDKELIKRKYKEYKNEITKLVSNHDEEALKNLLDKLYKYRQAGLDDGGELSEENIVFKILRAKGHLDKIKDSISKIYDKKASVNEIAINKSEYERTIDDAVDSIIDYGMKYKVYPDINKMLQYLSKKFGKSEEDIYTDIARGVHNTVSTGLEESERLDDGISSPNGKDVVWDYDENEGEFSLVPTDDDKQRKVFKVYGLPVYAAYRVMSKGVTAMANSDDEGSQKMAHELVNIRTAIKHPSKASKSTVSELVDISIDRFFKEQKVDVSKVTVIIPLGSKSPLNSEVAEKIKERLPNAVVLENFLQKDTWKNVQLSPVFWNAVKRRQKEGKPVDWYMGFKKSIDRKKEIHADELFGIKNVPPTTRMYFSMFYRTSDNYVVDAVKILNGANVLLVDDTLEAGATLVEAARALSQYKVKSLLTYIFLYGRDIKIAPAVPVGKK